MGCNTSRIDHLPAVALCRDRCKFLEEAIYYCHALADANLAYLVSLRAVASSLRPFLMQNNDNAGPRHSDSNHHHQPHSNSKVVTGGEKPSMNSKDDMPEEEEAPNGETDLLHPIHTNHFSYNHTLNIAPSPPPAPSSSAWDFLNFFETYDQGYELPVKGNGSDQPTDDEPQPGSPILPKSIITNVDARHVNVSRLEEELKPVSGDEQLKEGVEGVSKESNLFVRASASGDEVLRILDPRKLLSNRLSTRNEHNGGEFFSSNIWKSVGSFPEERSLSMSSTLRKLLIWEKKLYNEVKAEERLRILYAKKCRQVKILGEKRNKGSEFGSHWTLLGILFANIRVAIQVIERTSVMINNLRDEELQPLITELMLKLVGMWKDMEEYHRSQYQALIEPGIRFSVLSGANFGVICDANLEALVQLNIELQNTNTSFHNWIAAQRGLIKALNGWLMNPLDSEQEPEVLLRLSPGKLRGLPAVFVLCRKWSLAMDVVSETEVTDAMQGFSRSTNKLLEQSHTCLLKQKPSQGQDLDRTLTLLEKELVRMKKQGEVQGTRKLLLLQAKDISILPQEAKIDQMGKSMDSCLVLGVRQIIMAMERFSANMSQAYGEIHVHVEDQRHGQD